jgi:hypothetical protein
MGLDTTHDCWHGPYSTFNGFRRIVAAQVGMDLDLMEGFGGPVPWALLVPDPLHVLLNHPDCEGQIPAADCAPLADRLEQLLPYIEGPDDAAFAHSPAAMARQWIEGLRRAARAGEPVEFC